MEQKHVDVAILGGGPGGYTAALYCARADLKTLVLEKLSPGGQMATTSQVDNYPGFDEGIDGFSLGERMRRGAERFGARKLLAEVTGAALAGAKKEVCEALMQAATTDACLDILDQNGLREPVMHGLINAVQLYLERRAAGAFQVGAVLFSNQTGPLGQTETAEKLLQKWKES